MFFWKPMIKAVIFDFDGVIADTEALHFSCLRETLLNEGVGIDRRTYDEVYLALDDGACFKTAFALHRKPLTGEKLIELINHKSELFHAHLTEIRLFPGVADWIRNASPRFTLAICSGAAKHEIINILSIHRLLEHFSVVTAAEDVQNGKPSPEGYLKTLHRLNERLERRSPLVASECLVIEDSVAGVRAAKAAGMYCVGVTNSYPREHLQEADMVIDHLTELNLENASTSN